MYGGVIELYALTYSDGTGAEHDNLLLVADNALLLFLVGGVEIRNVTLEFARTGVNHLVHGHYAELPAL